MASLDILFGDVLAQVDELVDDAKVIADKRLYQNLYKEDVELFSAIGKYITWDEYYERNRIGILWEELFENKYGESLVSSWRDDNELFN